MSSTQEPTTPQPTVVTLPVEIAPLVEKIKTLFGEGGVTESNIISATIALMQEVESYSKLDGTFKKQLVIKTIESLVDIANPLIGGIVTVILPTVIDEIIAFDTNEKKIHGGKSCWCC